MPVTRAIEWHRAISLEHSSDNEQTITKHSQSDQFLLIRFRFFFWFFWFQILLETVIKRACSKSTPCFILPLAFHTYHWIQCWSTLSDTSDTSQKRSALNIQAGGLQNVIPSVLQILSTVDEAMTLSKQVLLKFSNCRFIKDMVSFVFLFTVLKAASLSFLATLTSRKS